MVEKDGWIVARKGAGYLALRSMQPTFWNGPEANPKGLHIRKEPEDFGRDLIAPGKNNIWLCQLGREADDGPFDKFLSKLRSAPVAYKGLSVTFDSPGNGLVQFGWQGPLRVNHREIAVHDYPRYDNPYVQAAFPADEIEVQAGKHKLHLHWETGTRSFS